MLKSLNVNNFSLFNEANFQFANGLNIFCGDNGTGKSSVLKLCHTVETCLFNANAETFGKISLYDYLFAKIKSSLAWSFKAKEIAHLANFNAPDHTKANIFIDHKDPEQSVSFSFNNINSNSFSLDLMPTKCVKKRPIWIDSSLSLLNFPEPVCRELPENSKKVIDDICGKIVAQIKIAAGNGVDVDYFGRCYLKETEEPLNLNCFSESIVQMLVILRMVKTGLIFDGGQLFLDCIDAHMGIKLKKCFAEIVCDLAQSGTQIFLATQSNKLIENISEFRDQKNVECKYFLHLRDPEGNVFVKERNG